MMADEVPTDKGSKEAIFVALAAEFSFDDRVKDLFLKGPMQNLEDFRYYFSEERKQMPSWRMMGRSKDRTRKSRWPG